MTDEEMKNMAEHFEQFSEDSQVQIICYWMNEAKNAEAKLDALKARIKQLISTNNVLEDLIKD